MTKCRGITETLVLTFSDGCIRKMYEKSAEVFAVLLWHVIG